MQEETQNAGGPDDEAIVASVPSHHVEVLQCEYFIVQRLTMLTERDKD